MADVSQYIVKSSISSIDGTPLSRLLTSVIFIQETTHICELIITLRPLPPSLEQISSFSLGENELLFKLALEVFRFVSMIHGILQVNN